MLTQDNGVGGVRVVNVPGSEPAGQPSEHPQQETEHQPQMFLPAWVLIKADPAPAVK
jgi:hypothetical protein